MKQVNRYIILQSLSRSKLEIAEFNNKTGKKIIACHTYTVLLMINNMIWKCIVL